MGTTTRGRAPYKAGDTITLIHTSDAGLTVADLPIECVVPLSDGRWRVEAHRQMVECPQVNVTVRADGYDDDGLIIPAVA